MLQELNYNELISIDGGSVDPTPYSVGHQVGKAVGALFTVLGVAAFFAN